MKTAILALILAGTATTLVVAPVQTQSDLKVMPVITQSELKVEPINGSGPIDPQPQYDKVIQGN